MYIMHTIPYLDGGVPVEQLGGDEFGGGLEGERVHALLADRPRTELGLRHGGGGLRIPVDDLAVDGGLADGAVAAK